MLAFKKEGEIKNRSYGVDSDFEALSGSPRQGKGRLSAGKAIPSGMPSLAEALSKTKSAGELII